MHKVLYRVILFHLLFTWYCLLHHVVHLQTDTLYSLVLQQDFLFIILLNLRLSSFLPVSMFVFVLSK